MIFNTRQEIFTQCCIKLMRDLTNIPFELVIVETGSMKFKHYADIYLHFSEPSSYTKEFNQAIDQALGDIIVQIANDIFVSQNWLEALLKCFEIKDCGVATLASSDLKLKSKDAIMEGIYGPLMAWKYRFKFDEDFEDIFSDSDLVMRMYEAGYRSLRNWKVMIDHLNQETYSQKYTEEERANRFSQAREMFIEKHKFSTHLVYRALTEGWIV